MMFHFLLCALSFILCAPLSRRPFSEAEVSLKASDPTTNENIDKFA